MPQVTTAYIQTLKFLQKSCGQECVDWAIGLLEEGHDSHYLRLLIGMAPPFDYYEVGSYRDGLLRELGLSEFDPADCISEYSKEQMQKVLNGELDLMETLEEISSLCISNNYMRDIYDFFSLWCAYQDLQVSDVQWYWNGATLENIPSIALTEMKRFVDSR